jgi:hypothetical protein
LYTILVESGASMKLVRLIKVCLNETTLNSVCVNMCLIVFDHKLSKKNEMLCRHCFSTLHWNMPLGTFRKKVRMKLNGTHQLLSSTDVYLLGDNIGTIKRNTKTLIDARSKHKEN